MLHPNLFFTQKDVEAYRARLLTDKAAKARYDDATEEAEECLKEAFITQAECDAHNDFRQISRQVNRFADVLGTKYLVEGDPRYLAKLKALIAHYIGYKRWYALEYVDRKPLPWHSDLLSTATTLALGRIYDVIREALTPDERKTFAEGIFELGVYPAMQDWVLHETRLHAVDSMGHNWWAVCIGEPGVGLLAIMDDLPEETVKPLFAAIEDALADFLTFEGNPLYNKIRTFDQDSLFYESLSYGDYATGALFRYLNCYERFFGRNERLRSLIPANISEAMTSFLYPITDEAGHENYRTLDFGDSHPDTHLDAFARGAILLGIDTPAVRKCASLHTPAIWDEIGGFRIDELEGDWASTPKDAFFASGFAILRDSWKPNATILGIKSGYAWNHSHNDAGHFILWHKGKAIFPDAHGSGYDNEIYRDYYCQDQSHNVLRIGGKGRVHDCVHFATKFPGTIPEKIEGDGFTYLRADCGGPMSHLCTRMFRNFFWIENRILVLFDDVFCIEENDVQFLLHYDGTYTRESDDAYLFDNGTGIARLVSHAPSGMVPTDVMGYKPHSFEEGMPYLSLSTPEKTLRHLLLHSIELDPALHDAKITYLKGNMAHGLRVKEAGNEYEMWFNVTADGRYMHDNSINTLAGFETDAYMLLIRRDPEAKREKVYMINGSFLRRDGKLLFGSHVKKTVTVEIEK